MVPLKTDPGLLPENRGYAGVGPANPVNALKQAVNDGRISALVQLFVGGTR